MFLPHINNKCPCTQQVRDYQRSVDLALGQILNHEAGEREGLVEKVLRNGWLVPNCLLTAKV